MSITSFRFRELSTNIAILSVASTVMPWEREKGGRDQKSKVRLDTGKSGLAGRAIGRRETITNSHTKNRGI